MSYNYRHLDKFQSLLEELGISLQKVEMELERIEEAERDYDKAIMKLRELEEK